MISDLLVSLRRNGGRIRFRVSPGIVLLVVLLALAGCQQQEGIVTYKIPTKVPEQLLPGKDRMLAAMVPRGSQVWFFKVLGPGAAVDMIDDQFQDFVKNIQFDAADEPVIDSLPEGWRRGGKKPLRFATIDINTPKKQLDLSISSLSAPEKDWDAYVAENVNRWRGQVGLAPSEDKWSGGQSIEIAAAQGQSIWVDVTGEPGAGGAAPMGMMPGGGPFQDGPTDATMAADPTASEIETTELQSEVPPGWEKQAVSKGGMREAAFTVGQSEVTVITAGGDLRSNVARWMGQVAGTQPDDAAVDLAQLSQE